MNTHRAVIESSVPPMLELIASGPKDFCENSLAKWIADHPLGEFETAAIFKLEFSYPIHRLRRRSLGAAMEAAKKIKEEESAK